jgi:hypothetical protein
MVQQPQQRFIGNFTSKQILKLKLKTNDIADDAKEHMLNILLIMEKIAIKGTFCSFEQRHE